MTYGIRLLVHGDYACFTRPEMKVERVSYDVITPSAARGILEAIHWKPAIRWVVDRIRVLRPVRFETIRRNELGHKIPAGSAQTAMNRGRADLHTVIEDDRQQRAAALRHRLTKEIDPATDSLRFYYLGANWRRRVEHVGAKPNLDLEGPLVI